MWVELDVTNMLSANICIMIPQKVSINTTTIKEEKTASSMLLEMRASKNISIKEVSESTYISESAIRAIESNNLQFFHTRSNAEGIALKYAKYLGLPEVEQIAALVRRDYLVNLPDRQHVYDTSDRPSARKLDLWIIGGISAIFIALLYFGFQIFAYLIPPKIIVTEPSAKSFTRVNKVRVEGNIDKESQVTINGLQANVDNNGNFFADVNLERGRNDIVILVTGVNGRTASKTITVTND